MDDDGRNGKVTVYVGCALTHASKDFCRGVEGLKGELRGLGFEILEFFDLKTGTAAQVTRHDLDQVERADLMLGIADEPSLGLGGELMYRAAVCGKPTLVVAHRDRRLSRFIEGMPSIWPEIEIQRYDWLNEVPALFQCFFAERLPSLTAA